MNLLQGTMPEHGMSREEADELIDMPVARSILVTLCAPSADAARACGS
jgi:hypothetical protein